MRLKLVYIYSFVVTLLYLLTACTDGIEASSDSNGQGEGKEIPVSIMPKLVAGDENEVSQLRVIIFSTRTSNPYGPKVLVSNQLIDVNEDYVAITYIGYNDIYVIGNEPVDLSGINSPEELKNIQMNTESSLSAAMALAHVPDPDLVIRTGAETRISNFLLWQSAYSEFYFSSALWPDFGAEQLDAAIADFAQRERRFGKTSEQITPTSGEQVSA